MSRKRTAWTFTIRDRKTGDTVATVRVTAANETQLRNALSQLAAPAKVLAYLRHQGVQQPSRLDWRTATQIVVGVRA